EMAEGRPEAGEGWMKKSVRKAKARAGGGLQVQSRKGTDAEAEGNGRSEHNGVKAPGVRGWKA
ncbi:MAG: hypothetical protein KBS81_03265, partial [Spirochaetales bacterium]|nr:hypothetical protein [Candidatus Physcosoma equi]